MASGVSLLLIFFVCVRRRRLIVTVEIYTTVAVVIDSVIGVTLCLAAARRSFNRPATAAISSIVAFGALSGWVIGYEVTYGKGFAAGFAWACMYSPWNLALSAGAPVVFVLSILLSVVARRLVAVPASGTSLSVDKPNPPSPHD